jgi:competence protein ComEA
MKTRKHFAFSTCFFICALPCVACAADLVNINTADKAALITLNGIGDAYAQRIIDYRTQHGPFAAIEDIIKVSGIGTVTFGKIKNFITVGDTSQAQTQTQTKTATQAAATTVAAKKAPQSRAKAAATSTQTAAAYQTMPTAEAESAFSYLPASVVGLGALITLGVGAVLYARRRTEATETPEPQDEFEIE